jgi:hypothetical protein
MSAAIPVHPLEPNGLETGSRLLDELVRQRNVAPNGAGDAPDLQSVLSIAELSRRPSRPPDHAAENSALIALAREMAASRDGVLQMLADTALGLCRAHSAGVSLLAQDQRSFYWPAIAGQWAAHIGGGVPSRGW